MKKINQSEALQFYVDNGLNEVISEKSQNRFQQQEEIKIVVEVVEKTVEKKSVSFFAAQVNSSHEAISSLAKRSQQILQNNMAPENKFTSLNDILQQAKDVAAKAKDLSQLRKAVEKFRWV